MCLINENAFLLPFAKNNKELLGTKDREKNFLTCVAMCSQYRLELGAIATHAGSVQNFDDVSGGRS